MQNAAGTIFEELFFVMILRGEGGVDLGKSQKKILKAGARGYIMRDLERFPVV